MRTLMAVIAALTLLTPDRTTAAEDIARIERTFTKGYFELRQLAPRSFVYSDREYVFDVVPNCLRDRTYMVTPNAEKFSRGAELVMLGTLRPVRVYVGYDSRYLTQPEWLLKNFSRTNDEITIVDPRSNRVILRFIVYRGEFNNNVTLGGNIAPKERGNFGMYTAVIVPADADFCG